VWTALIAFALAAASGLAGLVRRSDGLHRWSTGWARSGTLFWLTSLLLSLWAMQTSWNGLYLAEPRWRLGVQFGVVAILLQLALLLIHRLPVASALNAAFFAALALALLTAESVLHPSAPIATSGWDLVRAFFLALLAITLLAAWQLAGLLQPAGECVTTPPPSAFPADRLLSTGRSSTRCTGWSIRSWLSLRAEWACR
jgi:hypothetical protein